MARIEAADPRVSVLYEPGLLPVPRYPADHTGVARELSAAELGAWAALRRQADVSFDFDWQAPADMAANCPRLRWVQATSAGIGGFLDRTGLAGTGLVFTTAAGVHGVPLAEFALLGLLYFAKGMPALADAKAARRWQRYAGSQVAGSRALLVGLGGAGRAVARLLAAAGVEVCGAGRPGHRYDVPGVASYVASDQLHQVLPEVDALVLACPLTEQTRGLIGAAELALMRQGSVLVNISRGPVVDEEALVSALQAGHLRRRVPRRVRHRAAAGRLAAVGHAERDRLPALGRHGGRGERPAHRAVHRQPAALAGRAAAAQHLRPGGRLLIRRTPAAKGKRGNRR